VGYRRPTAAKRQLTAPSTAFRNRRPLLPFRSISRPARRNRRHLSLEALDLLVSKLVDAEVADD
jgi:hypothetical protein